MVRPSAKRYFGTAALGLSAMVMAAPAFADANVTAPVAEVTDEQNLPENRTVTLDNGDVYEVRGGRVFPNDDRGVFNFPLEKLDAYIFCKEKEKPGTPLSEMRAYSFAEIDKCVNKYASHLVDGKIPESYYEYEGNYYSDRTVSADGDVVFYRDELAFMYFPAGKTVVGPDGKEVWQNYMDNVATEKVNIPNLLECRKELLPEKTLNSITVSNDYRTKDDWDKLKECVQLKPIVPVTPPPAEPVEEPLDKTIEAQGGQDVDDGTAVTNVPAQGAEPKLVRTADGKVLAPDGTKYDDVLNYGEGRYFVEGSRVFPDFKNEMDLYNLPRSKLATFRNCTKYLYPGASLSSLFAGTSSEKLETCMEELGSFLVDGKLVEGVVQYKGQVFEHKKITQNGDVFFIRDGGAFVPYRSDYGNDRFYKIDQDDVENYSSCRASKYPGTSLESLSQRRLEYLSECMMWRGFRDYAVKGSLALLLIAGLGIGLSKGVKKHSAKRAAQAQKKRLDNKLV